MFFLLIKLHESILHLWNFDFWTILIILEFFFFQSFMSDWQVKSYRTITSIIHKDLKRQRLKTHLGMMTDGVTSCKFTWTNDIILPALLIECIFKCKASPVLSQRTKSYLLPWITRIYSHTHSQHPYMTTSASRSTIMSIINACSTQIMQTIIQTPKKLNKIFQGSGIWRHSQQPSTSSWAVHTWIRNRHLRCWNNLIYFPQPVKIYELNLTISKGDIQKC